MSGLHTVTGGVDGESRRSRHARIAIGVVRPVLLMFGVVGSAINTVADPGSVSGEEWLRLGIFGAIQVLLWILLRSPLAIEATFSVAVVLDAAFLAATLTLDDAPATGATTFIVLMVIVGYFVRPRIALAFSVLLATVVALIGPHLDGWNERGPVPTISVAILITGIAMAYISSRMRADEARLQQLVRDQQAALDRLRVVDALRDQIIANVSHELRTPLTTTVGAIETLLRTDIEVDDELRTQLLTLARDGGVRLVGLVEDLLTLGATRPDSLELMAEPEHLGSIVREGVAGIHAHDGRSIVVDAAADPLVRVDHKRMLQVVSNLVVNAINHGAGDVRVQTAERDGHAVLEVLDDGPGVDPSHVDELFLPFARFSNRPDSTGLGLAICRAIVESHHGTIRYHRTDDARTAFAVTLPLAPEAESADGRAQHPEPLDV